MRARQESIGETRQRITEAVVELHERTGPRYTTVSAIAAEAGVTRLTVYRHFPDDAALVAACSAHWATLHPRPDIATWRTITDLTERVQTALLATYRWAAGAAPMMTMIHRDLDVLPAFVAEFLEADLDSRVRALAEPYRVTGEAERRLSGVLRHALDIGTWESLCVRGRLTEAEAVAAMQAAAAAALRTVPAR